ncbi:MAG: pyridoxamine 5'-phosphate oxidase family protein [Dysgonomonas sp.]|nr:pyridoxamine 5'-phosphate oxidase family protein [Dysgonomonas sp.]
MSKYENAIKIMEERCGNGKNEIKEEVIALATISLYPNANGKPRPAARMVCAYYEDGAFYVSTDAKKSKTLQIEANNEVSVCGFGWYAFHGVAENLGWVKDEKNAEIRTKFKKVFDWFDEVGGEDNPDSIVLRIALTEGTITDNERKYGEQQYEIDFINKTVK